jgi:hypothetical protein
MERRNKSKRSTHKLKLLVERAVSDEWRLRPGLWFCVDAVEAAGHPIERITVWSTLHFSAAGSPYCCGEPMCHLPLASAARDRISEHVRRSMGLDQKVSVEAFKHVRAEYHSGVEFTPPKNRREG